MTPDEFQTSQARTTEAVLLLTRRQWDRMDTVGDWDQIASRVTVLTAAGQADVARRSLEYVVDQAPASPLGLVDTRAFVGYGGDGRPLQTLLYSAVVTARATYSDPAQQMEFGRKWLSMLAKTAVADAGRGAAGVQIAATPTMGYVRVAQIPCCKRCAVLVGKHFKWNDGFERHPNCMCVHVPAGVGWMPDGYQDHVDPDQIKDLTKAQRQAIDDGADINQVINAERGRAKGGMYTSEGTTRRGWNAYVQREIARQRGEQLTTTIEGYRRQGAARNYPLRRTGPRLTPEAIYRHAQSREEAVRLLAANGYILSGSLADIARLATT